jgi:hypothetical protein
MNILLPSIVVVMGTSPLHCKFCPSYHCKILVEDISGCISMPDASSNSKNIQSYTWIIANRLGQKTLQAIAYCFGIRTVINQFLLIIVDSSRRFSLEARSSSRSCLAGSNLRPFRSQAGAFDEFPMSSSKQSSSIDKGNGVGSSEPIPGAVS